MNILQETSIRDRLDIEGSVNKPSWYGTSAAYLRAFPRTRHNGTSDLLPADRRITKALWRLYLESDPVSKAVMDGTTELRGRQKSRIFDRLICRLAIESGMTGAVIMPPETEEKVESD